MAAGERARDRLPLEALADLAEPAGRDAVGLVARQEDDRLPDLLPLRHERMAASAFAFYRGTALVMAADLGGGVGGVRDYYVRQLHDWKGGVDVGALRPEGLLGYARLCAWVLARAHARSGDRFAIAGYLGEDATADEALADIAAAYADRAERDHAAFVASLV